MTTTMKTKITELLKSNAPFPKLEYEYTTNQHYKVQISHTHKSWTAKLVLTPLLEPAQKRFEEQLFAEHVEEPRAFTAIHNGEQIGWIQLGYEKWNNRMRVWELLIKKEHRRKGTGTQLMQHAIKLAKERGARMLVLETQSCNTKAIRFYLKHGYELIGFDTAAYSNQDIEKSEVRLELGLKL
jgi:ribosomal protein S18 acetylase RimI-like enzyme